MTALLGPSPCRWHPCSVEHADVVLSFREAARLWHERAEQATGGYAGDLARHREAHPPPTLRDHLTRYHRERRARDEEP